MGKFALAVSSSVSARVETADDQRGGQDHQNDAQQDADHVGGLKWVNNNGNNYDGGCLAHTTSPYSRLATLSLTIDSVI